MCKPSFGKRVNGAGWALALEDPSRIEDDELRVIAELANARRRGDSAEVGRLMLQLRRLVD